jgi:hypothetical protein
MPRFVIERDIPGVGEFTPAQLAASSRVSCEVLRKLGPQIQWVQSYVTADRLYCIYIAPDDRIIHEPARLGGFPATRVSKVAAVIDPTTAEAAAAAPVHA